MIGDAPLDFYRVASRVIFSIHVVIRIAPPVSVQFVPASCRLSKKLREQIIVLAAGVTKFASILQCENEGVTPPAVVVNPPGIFHRRSLQLLIDVKGVLQERYRLVLAKKSFKKGWFLGAGDDQVLKRGAQRVSGLPEPVVFPAEFCLGVQRLEPRESGGGRRGVGCAETLLFNPPAVAATPPTLTGLLTCDT